MEEPEQREYGKEGGGSINFAGAAHYCGGRAAARGYVVAKCGRGSALGQHPH